MKRLDEKWGLVKDDYQIWGDIKTEALLKVKELIEGTMEKWCEIETSTIKNEINIERKNEKYRSGHYKNRSIVTSFGELLLDVPKLRKGGHIKIPGIAKYKRFSPDFEAFLFEAFFTGVSTRKIKNLTKILSKNGVSAQKISSMIKVLKVKVDYFHRKKINKKYEYLIIDGVWINVVNLEGKTVKKVILAAIGVDKNFNEEIIGFKLTTSESKDNWNSFLSNLIYRGVNDIEIKCVVSDQHASIIDSVSLLFPNAKHQICVCHVINNVIKNIKKKYPKESKGLINKIKSEVKEIYRVDNKNECIKNYKNFIKKWDKKFDEALKPFKNIFEETLHYFNFDKTGWNVLKTSNHIERFFRTFRGRIKNFGSHFKNKESAENFFFVFVDNFNNNREFFSDVFK